MVKYSPARQTVIAPRVAPNTGPSMARSPGVVTIVP